MLKKISGNVINIPGNAQEDSKECSRRFRVIFAKILENAQKD